MLKKLIIQNFQSHKDTVLEFDPGVNVIVGASDSGKTSIIRALMLAIFNKPLGDEYRSHWDNEGTEVTIQTEEGNIITRIRGNSVNSYTLNASEFNAFKAEVPAEIEKALNLNEINLQQQLDSIFLLSNTAGERAIFFNKIAKFDKIDKGIQYLNKGLKTIKHTILNDKSEIKNKKEQLYKYDDLSDIELNIELLEEWEKKVEEHQNSIRDIKKILERMEEIELLINEYTDFCKQEETIDQLLELHKKLAEVSKEHSTIKSKSIQLFQIQNSISELTELTNYETQIEDLIKLHEKNNLNGQNLVKIEKLYKSINSNIERQETQLKSISVLEKNFNDIFPDVCPLCEHPYEKN